VSATCPYPEPDKSSPWPPFPLLEIIVIIIMLRTKDSVVGIVKRLQVEQSEVQIPGRKKASTHLQNVHSDPGDHLASC